MSYILGNPILLEKAITEELEDEDDASNKIPSEQYELSETEREDLLRSLNAYFDSIVQLAEQAGLDMKNISSELGINLNETTREERDILQELVEDRLTNMGEFHQLVDSILDDFALRLDFRGGGRA